MKTYKSNIDNFRLVKESSCVKKVKITNSNDSADYARSIYADNDDDINVTESMYVIFLNKANNTIGYKQLSTGGLYSCVVDVKLVAKYAINCLTNSIILVHNHPSGNMKASQSDLQITSKIKNALELFDIAVLDHIILGEDDYYSFESECLL